MASLDFDDPALPPLCVDKVVIEVLSRYRSCGGVSSLVETAACKVSSNLNMTCSAVAVMPHDLYPILLAASINAGLVVSTKAIVAAWPFATLSCTALQDYTKQASPREYHDQAALVVAMAISEQKDSRIQNVDITSLKLRNETKMQFLRILLEGRSSDSEPVRKKRMRHLSRDRVTEHKKLRILMNTSVSEDEARQFLKLKRSLGLVNIHVNSRHLKIAHCGQRLMEKCLSLAEKERTTYLDIGWNCLGNDGLIEVLPQIQDFTALTTLCLQYNFLDFNRRTGDCDAAVMAIGSTLASLPNIMCLALTGNRLTSRLAEILRPMRRPLAALDVSFCTLSERDIAYLASSHHAGSLQYLILSNNHCVARCWEAMERLLRNAAQSLVSLDLGNTDLEMASDNITGRLAALAPAFSHLKSVRLNENCIPAEGLADVIVGFSRCYPMRLLQLSLQLSGDPSSDRCSEMAEELRIMCFAKQRELNPENWMSANDGEEIIVHLSFICVLPASGFSLPMDIINPLTFRINHVS